MNLLISKAKVGRRTRYAIRLGGSLIAATPTQAKAVKTAERLIRRNGGGSWTLVPCHTKSARVAPGAGGLCAFKHCDRPVVAGKRVCAVHGGSK